MKKKILISLTIPIICAVLIIILIKSNGKKYYESNAYTWYTVIGSKDGDLLVRGRKIDHIKNNIHKLIFALNRSKKDPETFRTPKDKDPTDPPKLKLIDIQGPVANIKVINGEFLTQRMGSTGAEEFLAAATFTLTEYDPIKLVNFIFEKGDHAAPGTYSRKTFSKTWKIIE